MGDDPSLQVTAALALGNFACNESISLQLVSLLSPFLKVTRLVVVVVKRLTSMPIDLMAMIVMTTAGFNGAPSALSGNTGSKVRLFWTSGNEICKLKAKLVFLSWSASAT